jgi:GxxExxY protein
MTVVGPPACCALVSVVEEEGPAFIGCIAMERDPQTYAVIGAALEVHNALGPGHLEAVYQEALEIELGLRQVPFRSHPRIELEYKGRTLKKYYRPDFIVYDRVIVEIKAQEALGNSDDAQLINSLKCSRKEVGLLVNFGERSLQWRRFVNTGR